MTKITPKYHRFSKEKPKLNQSRTRKNAQSPGCPIVGASRTFLVKFPLFPLNSGCIHFKANRCNNSTFYLLYTRYSPGLYSFIDI